jgi:hypothetical protein
MRGAMQLPLSNPQGLASDPELAALEIALCSAEIARRALFAAYPELVSSGDFFIEEPNVAPRQCLAVAVVSALDTLIDAVEHYRAHLENCTSQRGLITKGEDIPF